MRGLSRARGQRGCAYWSRRPKSGGCEGKCDDVDELPRDKLGPTIFRS